MRSDAARSDLNDLPSREELAALLTFQEARSRKLSAKLAVMMHCLVTLLTRNGKGDLPRGEVRRVWDSYSAKAAPPTPYGKARPVAPGLVLVQGAAPQLARPHRSDTLPETPARLVVDRSPEYDQTEGGE
jgi:hypothetical protein